MDWKYILSLTPDNLPDEDKDQLYSTIAWFDFDSEKLEQKKYVALLKISQEVMKYKAEQVEALLAELDEIAVRQGEEEARKQDSFEDLLSLKSKKSQHSTDYDEVLIELEQKYKEVKLKLKQQTKINENQKKDLDKLKRHAAILEQEKLHLQTELQSVLSQGDESRSDISETITDQYKELIHTVQQKNKQISELLGDIENVEKENLHLRENMSKLKDELQDATNQVSTMTSEYMSLKLKMDEQSEIIDKLEEENQAFQSHIQDFVEEKQQRDNQIDEFIEAIDARVEEWKRIINEKNDEIQKLKGQVQRASLRSSSENSLSVNSDRSYVELLNKAIFEREEQLSELQTQLQDATKEMEKSTKILKQLTADKSVALRKIDELSKLVKNLKSQLQAAHERSQELQEGIEYAESIAESKQDDINEIVGKLKSGGNLELSESLEQIQKLKAQVRVKDKQIAEYVKITNKLQATADRVENENTALRDKYGVPQDEDINITSVLLKKRRQTKEADKLQKQILVLEDEKLNLRGELRQLNQKLAVLSKQILDYGGKPEVDVRPPTETDFPVRSIPIEPKGTIRNSEQQYAVLLGENEALRKGLHEILESVKLKNESGRRQMKSETLEKLLHTLDARHVSGWYHPAMRLQAELHTLQGVNTELREQLRIARLELNSYHQLSKRQDIKRSDTFLKDGSVVLPLEIPHSISSSTKDMVLSLNNHLLNVLNTYHDEEDINTKLHQTVEEYKKVFDIIEQQLKLLYDEYQTEKEQWKSREKIFEKTINKLEEQVAVLNVKLKEFSSPDEEEFKKVERLADMSGKMIILNRKCVYLENEESRLSAEVKKLNTNLANAEIATLEKLSKLHTEKNELLSKLATMENVTANSVKRQTLLDVQNSLDVVTLKHRETLQNFNALRIEYSKEFAVLNETVRVFEEQKTELQNQLLHAVTNLHIQESVSVTNDVEVLSKKLAQSEVSEAAEKQRANHMSNLYSLVKEQLQKSEERCQDFEKYNQEILHQNLVLQENVKNLEDKLIDSVDINTFTNIETKHSKSFEEIQELRSENSKLKERLNISKKSQRAQTASMTSTNLEVLNLKHQILDLQASGDDKALIARLTSDVVLARLSETQSQKKIEDLEMELKECQDNYDTYKSMFQQEKVEKENAVAKFQHKISVLENIIHSQRQQYLGSIPLISEESFNTKIQQILKDKQAAFASLQNIRKQEHNSMLQKEQFEKQIDSENDLKLSLEANAEDVLEKIKTWHQERTGILIKELKCRRELEFKTMQLDHLSYRLNSQDELILKLEKELIQCYHKYDPLSFTEHRETLNTSSDKQKELVKTPPRHEELKLMKHQDSQTTPELRTPLSGEDNVTVLISDLQTKLNSSADELIEKNNTIEQLKTKITELEMNVSLFRSQIGDKQSQITFYEKHILDLQNKISKLYSEPPESEVVSNAVQPNVDEVVVLKEALRKLQDNNLQKEGVVLKYQTLLKRDRDEHSLAAARAQQELKRLQEIIAKQEKGYKELKETTVQHPGRAAIEQYILQVHALEKHTAGLHTTVSTLNSQLQASRQEAARWQKLANERLDSMEQLRTDLEEQHQNEIAIYKKDSERWREEILKLKEVISKHRSDISQIEPDINNIVKAKDEEIQELAVTLKRVKMEMKKHSEKSDSLVSPKVIELESANEQVLKEYESLKKRYEQVLMRERNAKGEIRSLKEQMLKKPASARSDKSDKEERLQKKIKTLEKEVEDFKDKLEKQLIINEVHRVAVTDDFEKWKKQKYWQQTSEKLKTKLQEKSEEFEKLSQTCAGYRILIERLEREKHNLENKVKSMRHSSVAGDNNQLDFLKLENERLHYEMQALNAKAKIQHRHSGGLGAAMLQEKLEAQERKIAILEIASKGSGELRDELERVHNTIENLQKINLRLEAENLELKLDMEKYGNDAPRLREQIQHLESYIEVLKSENQTKHATSESKDPEPLKPDVKKLAELERTVFVLKRVVEKLQVENRRLQGGSRPCSGSDRSASADKIRADNQSLKQQYGESVQQVARLEDQLKSANSRIALLEKRPLSAEIATLSEDLSRVKAELAHKSQLLDKIKILLHRAAIKEKALLEEISTLKALVPPENQSPDSSSLC